MMLGIGDVNNILLRKYCGILMIFVNCLKLINYIYHFIWYSAGTEIFSDL